MEKERERAAKMSYPSPINDTKADTDKLYDAALEFCVTHLNTISVCAGSHNETSATLLAGLMKKNNIPNNHPHIWFSQLLGMSDHISFNLANQGYNVVLAKAEFATLRLKLLKIAARVVEMASRVRLAFAAACPEAELFAGLPAALMPRGP